MAKLDGVIAAALTPLDRDGACDGARLAAHCAALLGAGCAAVALFGTTGEGPSFSVAERRQAVDAVLSAGVPADRILVGLLCSALGDAVELGRHAHDHDCAGVFMMPPFFFREPGEDGLFAAYARVLEALGPAAGTFYLYNFPALVGAAITPALLARLAEAFPQAIAGIKDSAGDLAGTAAFLDRCPDLAVYTGWELQVPALRRLGCRGTVSGMANAIPQALAAALADAEALAQLEPLIELVAALPVIPAIRVLTALATGEPSWRVARPPLMPLDAAQERRLLELWR